MAANLAEEIKEVEARSKAIVKEARNEAARMLSEARDESERSIKEAKQKAFRLFKENSASAEKEAEERATKNVEAGRKESEKLAGLYHKKVDGTAQWISEEVISRYGSGGH